MCARASGSLGLHPADLEPLGSGPCLRPPQAPLYYPLYIIVGGRRGSLLKGIAVGSWRSPLVEGDLSPQLPAPIKDEPRIRHGEGLGAPEARLLALPPGPARPACPCSLRPVTSSYPPVSSSPRSASPSPCFQAASFPCRGR